MSQRGYVRPAVSTVTGEQLLDRLGPVSCGSATGDCYEAMPVQTDGSPVGGTSGGRKGFF